jgi:formylglycine-generating enzyme required for sulfatase activity
MRRNLSEVEEMKLRTILILLWLLLAGSAFANVAPVVTNVQAVQQASPSQLVVITYDVLDTDGDAMTVSLQISADGGATWAVPVNTVSGDIGDGILSGVGYQIIWDAGIDYPSHSGTEYQAKVLSDDHQEDTFEGMVLVPAGPYDMGATYQSPYSLPIHTVTVPAFYIDIYEVTNAQYKAFCDATSRAYPPDPTSSFYTPPYFSNPTYANYPVVNVDWYDAGAYAVWAGKRLPTEAEWERAAKGNADNRRWPWGDTWIAANANVGSGNADGYTYTSPVGNYPEGMSSDGCYDMAGNVWEWCEDDWHSSYNIAGRPDNGSAWIDNPRGSFRVERGGSWDYYYTSARCANRNYNYPSYRYSSVGFRCARTP